MNKIFAIAKKELSAYFKSPIAYIVLFITMASFNIFFYMILDLNREATLRDIFRLMEFMFVFIIPLLTMKTFAEEKITGTMEFLMTTPTTNTTIVLGKYLANVMFFTLIILLTLPYYFIIEMYSNPDRIGILTGYIGLWLEGILFVSIGVLCSSWTKNQIVAAITSYIFLFLLYFSIGFTTHLSGLPEAIVRNVSIQVRAENFYSGLMTSADLVYFLSGILLCITLTRLSIENRLWR